MLEVLPAINPEKEFKRFLKKYNFSFEKLNNIKEKQPYNLYYLGSIIKVKVEKKEGGRIFSNFKYIYKTKDILFINTNKFKFNKSCLNFLTFNTKKKSYEYEDHRYLSSYLKSYGFRYIL